MMSPDGAAWARFDDLCAGTAVRCPPPDRVLIAERPQDVATAQLPVHDRPDRALPLVWFGIGDEPVAVPPVSDAGSVPALPGAVDDRLDPPRSCHPGAADSPAYRRR